MDAKEATLRGLLARDVLREVGAALSARGIRWAALKGAALHALGIREVAERPLEDVDVLVDTENLGAALDVLRAIGFSAGVEDAVTVTCVREGMPLPLDLHYRVFFPGLFRLEARDVLARSRQSGDVWVPSPLDLYAHLVGHFAKSRLGPSHRVHLSDFGAVATVLGLDAKDVARHLADHGLGRAARYVLSLAHEIEHDGFAGRVLNELAPDAVGVIVAAIASRTLRSDLPPPTAMLAANALNDTLFRGAVSFARQFAAAIVRRRE